MDIDLCMWAKNGSAFLPSVLKRIEEVIPKESVNEKIFVDDSSVDNTVNIAESFNWTVYENVKGGFCGGFNEALKHVKSEFFISVEQDVILNPKWFDIVPAYMDEKDVAVAQGIRVPSQPLLKAIYEDKLKKEFVNAKLTSLDNNIWRTKFLKEIGGFPDSKRFMADRYLYPKIVKSGYKWVVDRNVISIHIKEGIKQNLQNYYNGMMRAEIEQPIDSMRLTTAAKKTFEGTARAWRIAVKNNVPSILAIYPYMCLMNGRTFFERRRVLRGKPVMRKIDNRENK